jgi:hypothetical protein
VNRRDDRQLEFPRADPSSGVPRSMSAMAAASVVSVSSSKTSAPTMKLSGFPAPEDERLQTGVALDFVHDSGQLGSDGRAQLVHALAVQIERDDADTVGALLQRKRVRSSHWGVPREVSE